MKTLRTRAFRFATAALIMTVFVVSASAVTFTNASLKGGYSFLINRWTADSTVGQEGILGVMVFDGAGHVTISFVSIDDAVVQSGSGSGTYVVHTNGTGTITFTSGTNPPVFSVVLNSSVAALAHQFELIQTNDSNNRVESGIAILQTTAATTYTNASVKGTFGFQLSQWTADSTEAEDGLVGVVTFNGTGGVKGSYTGTKGGVSGSATFTGTYTTSSNGLGSMSLTTSDGGTPQLAFSLNTVVSGLAKGTQLLQVNGTGNHVHSGVALKQ